MMSVKNHHRPATRRVEAALKDGGAGDVKEADSYSVHGLRQPRI